MVPCQSNPGGSLTSLSDRRLSKSIPFSNGTGADHASGQQNMGPMTGQVTGRPRSPGDVRGDWSTLFTGHWANGRSGFFSDQPRSPGEVRGRPGETLHRAWGQGPARFLASLGHPGMYGVTGRQYLQNMGLMTGQVTGRPRSPGDVRGDWSTLSTGHAATGRSGF